MNKICEKNLKFSIKCQSSNHISSYDEERIILCNDNKYRCKRCTYIFDEIQKKYESKIIRKEDENMETLIKKSNRIIDRKNQEKPFDVNEHLYIMGNLNADKAKYYNARRKIYTGDLKEREYHITFFSAIINGEHSEANKFKEMYDSIYTAFLGTKISNIKLSSPRGSYKLMGHREDKKFYSRIYYIGEKDKEAITEFRIELYNLIANKLNVRSEKFKHSDVTVECVGGLKYHVFKIWDKKLNREEELLAVPEYERGIGIFTPHVSIVKNVEIKKRNNGKNTKNGRSRENALLIRNNKHE